jgi:hypothetical protein
MKKGNLLMFGFILLILIGSIQFLTVFAGDPVPGIDISLEQIPPGIKVDLGGYLTEYGIVIGTTESQDKDFVVVLDIIPLSNFQQNVQDELVASKNIRKNISTVTKQADSPYEFYATSPGHKSVEELSLYRMSLNSADLSNEELKNYIVKRIEQQEQVRIMNPTEREDTASQRGGYISGKGGDGKIESGESTQPRPKVPVWIKNNAEWFSQGVISEDDFVKGLEWMVNNGIIRVESVGIKEEGVK